MENQTYKMANEYVNQMIELHGPNYLRIHKAILDNCVNSNYSRQSNDFVTYVWQILDEKQVN